jgi:hypothetical protein
MRLYQGVYRPERRKMTAGKSIVAEDVAPDESAMLEHLTQQLKARLLETK